MIWRIDQVHGVVRMQTVGSNRPNEQTDTDTDRSNALQQKH